MTAINSNRAIRGPVTAVPIVAGNGVRLVADTENNRWVVEADETVLWEGSEGPILSNGTLTLSESPANFEQLRFEYLSSAGQTPITETIFVFSPDNSSIFTFTNGIWTVGSENDYAMYIDRFVARVMKSAPTTLSYYSSGIRQSVNGTSVNSTAGRGLTLKKIIGINRIASN